MRFRWILLGLLPLCLVACGGEQSHSSRELLRDRVLELGLASLEPAPVQDPAKVALGRALFFDPLLSGARDVACATCHHPLHGTSDGRSMSVGTQSRTVDGVRVPGPDHTFIPRNAVALWDAGQSDLSVAFWDRRLARQHDDAIVLYDAGYDLSGEVRFVVSDLIESLPGAVALFPVIDRDEMRGEWGENDVYGQPNELAMILDQDFEAIWAALMDRVRAVDGYGPLLNAAYPGQPLEALHFAHAADAIGAFITESFSSTHLTSRTAWDDFLDGDDQALSDAQARGALLFYGEAGCVRCHAGVMMSDEKAYNFGVRPMGTGPKHDHEDVDLGAASITHAGDSLRYAFRTPRLRNVAITGPWMHNGLYASLEAVVRHKTDPLRHLETYDATQIASEFQGQVHRRPDIIEDVKKTMPDEIRGGLSLREEAVVDLVAFLGALTSPHALALEQVIPEQVPSGLPVAVP